MNTTKYIVAISGVMIFLITPSHATASDTSAESDNAGKFWFDVRLRAENVDQDNALNDATATSLRTRIGYETKKYGDFRFLIEGENISALIDEYNSTTNGETQYSVIADPEDTELNRVYLSYTGIPKTSVAVGRQKIIFDNARFIGNVGWRQNEQTFDSLTVVNSSIPDTTVKFAYIDKVRRIFGPDSPIGTTDMSSPIVNVTYDGFSNVAITVYGYFLEFDDAPLNSQKTLGIRVAASKAFDRFELKYGLEIADQQDYGDGSSAIDAGYYHATLGAKFAVVDVGVGYESLGGDGNYGFQTPLATGHAFNGWSDMFLSTPAAGLTDMYVSLSGQVEKIKMKTVYHIFESDVGSQDYGSEIDFVASRKFGKHFLAGAKYSNYSADQHGVDTTKYWLFGQFNY